MSSSPLGRDEPSGSGRRRTRPGAPPPTLFPELRPGASAEAGTAERFGVGTGTGAGSGPASGRIRRRALVGAGLMAVWTALIAGRLVEIQVLQHDRMVERAESQYRHSLSIPPIRGDITDRRGRPLAITIPTESVYAAPTDFDPGDVEDAARRLAGCLNAPEPRVAARLRRDSRFSWLKRRATPEEVACVRKLGLPTDTIEEPGRFYPGGTLAASVIGYVGVDNEGLGGVEYAFDGAIRGSDGLRMVWTDGRRNGAASRVERRARAGRDVELTLDRRVQQIAEAELARAISETGSRAGALILLDVASGDVLAMASLPSFDPNRYRDFPAANWTNRAITDTFEPGSTFKIVTASAVLEEGLATEDEEFDTHGGEFRVGSRVVRDWKPLGAIPFADVIARSSNIGALQAARRLGAPGFPEWIRSFGFGSPTGIGLGGESQGILPAGDSWRPIRLATVSFGQGIGVTAIQMAQAVNVIASGGLLRRPRLIRSIGGEVVEPEPGARVIREATAGRMKRILLRAVETGTGTDARVPGFEIAGKTGTAQKAVPGGYSETDYIASFTGFAPAREPLFSGVVLLDSPTPDYSGGLAAGVFGRVASRVLWRFDRAGSDAELLVGASDPPPNASSAGEGRARSQPESRRTASQFAPVLRRVSLDRDEVGSDPTAAPTMPDLLGRPARDALAAALRAGFAPAISGSGRVVAQVPEPGAPLPPDARVSLRLGTMPRSAEPREPESPPSASLRGAAADRVAGEASSAGRRAETARRAGSPPEGFPPRDRRRQ